MRWGCGWGVVWGGGGGIVFLFLLVVSLTYCLDALLWETAEPKMSDLYSVGGWVGWGGVGGGGVGGGGECMWVSSAIVWGGVGLFLMLSL